MAKPNLRLGDSRLARLSSPEYYGLSSKGNQGFAPSIDPHSLTWSSLQDPIKTVSTALNFACVSLKCQFFSDALMHVPTSLGCGRSGTILPEYCMVQKVNWWGWIESKSIRPIVLCHVAIRLNSGGFIEFRKRARSDDAQQLSHRSHAPITSDLLTGCEDGVPRRFCRLPALAI